MTDALASSSPPATDVSIYCSGCGYDLRALETERCPECGRAFDPGALPAAPIPWLLRNQIGRWNAFWKTVVLVILHPQALAEQVNRPVQVDLKSAVRFRAICSYIFALTLSTALILLAGRDERLFAMTLGSLATVPATLLFCWFAASPVDSSGFRSPASEIRFLRLHQFTAAPLGLTPFILLPAALAGIIFAEQPHDRPGYLMWAMLGLLAGWMGYTLAYQKLAARRSQEWLCCHLVVCVLLWGLICAFCLMLALFFALLAMALAGYTI